MSSLNGWASKRKGFQGVKHVLEKGGLHVDKVVLEAHVHKIDNARACKQVCSFPFSLNLWLNLVLMLYKALGKAFGGGFYQDE